jgi:hypothetical protein
METAEISCQKKFKYQPGAAKMMVRVFWDSQEPVLEHFHGGDVTFNMARLYEMLSDRLKATIPSKRRGQLSLLCCCMTIPVLPTLQQMHFDILEHPPYNYLAPLDPSKVL